MKKTLICIALILTLIFTCSVSVSAEVNSDILKSEFFDYYYNGSPENYHDPEVFLGGIVEHEDMIIFIGYAAIAPNNMLYAKRFGDWYCDLPSCDEPSCTSVYVKCDDKIYTLDEAWDEGILTDITPVLELRGNAFYPVGDVNRDKEINIKDVTELQKHFARYDTDWYSSYRDEAYDFNNDGKLNIRDATAIQKSLAHIEA